VIIDYLTAVFLGFIEGLTEFIPVSSTGHLILLVEGLNFPSPPGHVFEVFIQIGAIMAIVVLYWQKLWGTALSLHSKPESRSFALNIAVGCIPAVILGVTFHGFIKEVLYAPHVIAVTLIIGGVILIVTDKLFQNPKTQSVDDVSLKQAFLIGCAQAVALIPGVSRSGATIVGALSLGLSRQAAAEFSFFMAIPVMFGAVAYDLYKNWESVLAYSQPGLMAAGLISSFLTALVVVKFMIGLITKYGFAPFGWYRIALGLTVFVIFS
jgi:undecaprenyl-diphosphatase